MPELLAEKLAAPSVEAGVYDLVIDPSNLWLTIHESIGHATELDRAVGYEAAYAGTSFATFDQLGTLRYGSPVMHVTGDRTVEHGLATVAIDDEGVAAQSFDLVRDGVLVGYQLDRSIAAEMGFGRSNGCAFADSPLHVPIQRMANVSLAPAGANGGGADHRGAHRRRRAGHLHRGRQELVHRHAALQLPVHRPAVLPDRGREAGGQVKDVAYQATTTDFWGAMEAVGGASTYVLGGAFNCGKGQPGPGGTGQPRLPVGAGARGAGAQRAARRRGGDGD
jgi:TldD protein